MMNVELEQRKFRKNGIEIMKVENMIGVKSRRP